MTPGATNAARNTERIGSPSRPPEEIRNILSRYRSGLQSGRDQGTASDETTGDDTDRSHE
jgi:hypothetical protein